MDGTVMAARIAAIALHVGKTKIGKREEKKRARRCLY
jgi:hypothetical protein